MRVVVVANGDVDPSDAEHARRADLVLAADGGAAHLGRWGIAPALVIGDLDSAGTLDPAQRVERHPAEKDKTDTELAVDRAFASGADEVILLGALGSERADHALANALLPALDPRVKVVRGATSVRAVRGGSRIELAGAPGSLVTLLAVGGDASGVWTEGLRYVLRGETLALGSSRGVSNEMVSERAAVSVGSGTLLVVEIRSSQGALDAGPTRPRSPGPPSTPAEPEPEA